MTTNHQRARHMDKGGRIFIPQSRMRHIRWEESVARARAKRDGNTDPVILHTTCHCGSVECLGTPFARS